MTASQTQPNQLQKNENCENNIPLSQGIQICSSVYLIQKNFFLKTFILFLSSAILNLVDKLANGFSIIIWQNIIIIWLVVCRKNYKFFWLLVKIFYLQIMTDFVFNYVLCRSPSCGLKIDRKSNCNRNSGYGLGGNPWENFKESPKFPWRLLIKILSFLDLKSNFCNDNSPTF